MKTLLSEKKDNWKRDSCQFDPERGQGLSFPQELLTPSSYPADGAGGWVGVSAGRGGMWALVSTYHAPLAEI